jgi:hypothetical protein
MVQYKGDEKNKRALLLFKGAFTNYVDKTTWVDGTGNVNGLQIYPYFSKGIPSQMSTGSR